jgi:hypothetical protein
VAVTGFDDLLRRLGFDLSSMANALGALFQQSIVRDGRRRTGVLLAGQTTARIEHGLGRSYQAALLETADGPLDGFRCLPAGADSAQYVTVAVTTAPVANVTLSVWVY